MLGTSILSYKNTLSRNTQRIFIHLALHLAANCVAFCTKLHCILHQIALRFAPNYTAFSTKLHRVLHQNAAFFVANSTPSCYRCNFMQYQRLCQCLKITAILHKKNARENWLFAPEWTFGELQATHNVKVYTIKFTTPTFPLNLIYKTNRPLKSVLRLKLPTILFVRKNSRNVHNCDWLMQKPRDI